MITMKNEINDKLLQRMEDGREYRNMMLEVREAGTEDEDSMIVEGYATTFMQPYLLYDWDDYKVYEQVDSRAFDDCDMSDVIMQYDHQGRVFARTKNNTLQLNADATGLKVTADLSGTEIGRQLYEEIKGGYTTKMSFGFVVKTDECKSVTDHDSGVTTVTRTITNISKLYDVSAVSLPANDSTTISAKRSADGVIQQVTAERRELAKKKLRLLLSMEE